MMREKFSQRVLLPAAIILAGFTAIVCLSSFIANARPAMPESYEDADLNMNGSQLKGFAFGMEGLLADWYFMRSLQYIGYKVLRSKAETLNIDDLRELNPRLLHPLLKNATDLDPHFIAAYSYGAIVLPAIDPEKAVDLAAKGVASNPDEWRLYQHLGYIYWRLRRYDKASETYEKGSQIAGAAPFMKMMAAAMKTQGGTRETARAIYQQMLAGSDDEQVRITAERHLAQIDSLDEREAIDRVLGEFKERSGRCAANFGEILSILMGVKLPGNREFRVDRANRLVDPTGAPYILDETECKAVLDKSKTAIASD